jgi:hypothetical protein
MLKMRSINIGWMILTAAAIFLAPAKVSGSDDCIDLSGSIAVTDANIVNGLSPLNWVREKNYIYTSTAGAYLQVGFKGTCRVEMDIDTSVVHLNGAVAYPVIAWSVNGGRMQTHQLYEGEKSITLACGVKDPMIDLYAKGFSPFENRYQGEVPDNCVKITGFRVNDGATTVPVSLPQKLWVNIGDSIMSGDASEYAKGQGRPFGETWSTCSDGRLSYGYLLAHHYGYRESRIAFGGYDWGGGLGQNPALSTLADQVTGTVSRLTDKSWNPKPDVVLINLGENGPPAGKDVTDALAKIRLRSDSSTKIIVMTPLSGRARKEVTDAFNAYKDTSKDPNVFLVDLGSITYDTADGQHPVEAGHQAVYQAALSFLDKIVFGR